MEGSHDPVDDASGSPLSITVDDVDVAEEITVRVIVSEPGKSSLSVAEAVMVCVPAERADVENAAPLPMTPSRFERHERLSEMLLSSVSMVVPVKVIESYRLNDEPVAGAVIATTGAVFPVVSELSKLTASALVEHPPTAVDTIDTLA